MKSGEVYPKLCQIKRQSGECLLKKESKMSKKSSSHLPSDETILMTDCHYYKTVGKDGICLATKCLIRQAGNIENYPGECQLYERLK